MTLISLRTLENATGVVYDNSKTKIIYAEDYAPLKAALQEGSTEVLIRVANLTTAEKNALTAYTGMIVWDETLAKLQYYNGSSWADVGSGSGSGDTSNREDKRGSNCSGTDGDPGRILTLSNTEATIGHELVFVNGVCLHDPDYTMTDLAASSTILFNNPVWDTDYIRVLYFT